MKILVTGAGGFLGSHLVEQALRRGHTVRAMIRPAAEETRYSWHGNPDVEVVRHDLRVPHRLPEALRGADVVIHAAASKTGDFYTQFAGTVLATENLLAAMRHAGSSHIVLISSFAVYDYLNRRSWAVLDESSPLEPIPSRRYPYCETKLMQERLVRDAARVNEWRWTIIRPGAIYGPGQLWTDRLGFRSSRCWWRFGGWARIPLTYVASCAEAIVLAAETPQADGRVYNIVDDDPPRQRHYFNQLRRRINPRARVVPVPWTVLRCAARGIWAVNRLAFGGRAKVPNLLTPANLHAVYKPLRYSNEQAKKDLGWRGVCPLEDAIERSLQAARPA